MAYFDSTRMGTDLESPISKFLELKKGEFCHWNKEEQINEVHNMNNFVVLDIGYTVKGRKWSNIEQKNVLSIYSNEIKHYGQNLIVVEMNFITKEKKVIAKGLWKDIKESIPTYARLNFAVTVLDLNDMLIKELFLYGNNFYRMRNFISKESRPGDILSIEIKHMYTNGSKDKDGNEILVDADFVNGLKGIEASNYKNRYVLDVKNTGVKFEDVELLDEKANILDEYFENKYKNWNLKEIEEDVEEDIEEDTEENIKEDIKEDRMYKPTEEQLGNVSSVKYTRDGKMIIDGVEIPF